MIPGSIVVWAASRPGAPLEPRRAPAPAPAVDEVVVAVEAAALGGPEARAAGRGTGTAPGEAAVGRVVAAGDAATDLVGKRVLVGPIDACGECDACRRAHPAICPGGRRRGVDVDGALASHVVARARWVLALDGPLEGAAPGPSAAALPREAALAATMFARAGVAPGDATVWLGGGPVAALGRAIASARGAQAIAPVDHELALSPFALEAALRARLSADAGPAGAWKVFETSGRDAGRRRALAIAGPGGTVVLAAGSAVGSADDSPLTLASTLEQDGAIVAVAGAHADLLPETVALSARGEIDLASVITEIPVGAVNDQIAALRGGSAVPRLAVVTGLGSD